MKVTFENFSDLPLGDDEKKSLKAGLYDIDLINCMTGREFYIEYFDDGDFKFKLFEPSFPDTVGDPCNTIKDLEGVIITVMDVLAILGYDIYNEVGKGWWPLLREARLLVELYNMRHKDEEPVTFVQIKEKWGELRLYLNRYPEGLADEIKKLEEKSASICEACGKEGTQKDIRGWVHTVCDDCLKEEEERWENLMKK